MPQQLDVSGFSAQAVYQELVAVGISDVESRILIAEWIAETVGRRQRTFNYATPFQQVDGSCSSDFVRQLAHVDWIDGESVVQAEETSGEDGFNRRFHLIEDDLDALGQNVARAFVCLAEMRQEVHALLGEIRTEVNRINGDIHRCCHQDTFPTVPTFPGSGQVQLASMAAGAPTYRGKTTVFGRPVSVWDTSQGTMMLPLDVQLPVDLTLDPRIADAGAFAEWIAETPKVRAAFEGQRFTVAQVVDQFGSEALSNGRTVNDVLLILDPATRRSSLASLVEAVIDRQAAVLRTTLGAREAALGGFGLTADGKLEEAPLTLFANVPERYRGAFEAAGVETVGELARRGTADIMRVLSKQGVELTEGQAAAYRASAKTLVELDRGIVARK